MAKNMAKSWAGLRHAPLFALLFAAVMVSEPATAWTLKIIHSFCDSDCTDGAFPNGLITDGSGRLFGSANDDRYFDAVGTVFELIPNDDRSDWQFKILHTFCRESKCADGARPFGDLIRDTAGNLYGTATDGGVGNSGAIFKVSQTGKYQILYSLCPSGGPCDEGYEPTSLTYAGASEGLPYDGQSTLYGISGGGAYGYGNSFALERKKHTWEYKVLHAFCSRPNCIDGALPIGQVIDPTGALYGIAIIGGKSGYGVLYKLAPAGRAQWSESVIHQFCTPHCMDGGYPNNLSLASDGSLLGSAGFFGPTCHRLRNHRECGVLFQAGQDRSQYKVLYGFCAQGDCLDGRSPIDLQEIQSGTLLGATYLGGASDSGTIFEIQDGAFHPIYQFCSLANCEDGQGPPRFPLVVDSSGSIFGTTLYGGAYGYGEVFELSP